MTKPIAATAGMAATTMYVTVDDITDDVGSVVIPVAVYCLPNAATFDPIEMVSFIDLKKRTMVMW